MILLLLLAQATPVAPVAPARPGSQSWSILEPVKSEPCVPAKTQADDDKAQDGDVVVCARPLPSQKLPYPDEVVPKGPTPSNPEMTARGALDAEAAPCATRLGGCQVGFGPPIVPMIMGAVDVAKRTFARKPDRTGRVPIELDAEPTGRLLP